MRKKWLLIPVVLVGFVLLLTLGLLLNITPQVAVSEEADTNAGSGALESLNAALVEVSKTVKPSVVNISTTSKVKRPQTRSRRDPFWEFGPFRDLFPDDFFEDFFREPQSEERTSLGSGVIVDKDGYILTNNHVVAGIEGAEESKIKVTLSDKREFGAELIGKDPETDVAVIKIEAKELPAVKLGDSDNLQVGEIVLAIGSPFGLSHTVTQGIISATGRSGFLGLGMVTYQDFIQTDAEINRGNSGGPLVNIKKEVIGINTFIIAPGGGGNVGVGFSIPINMARDVMDQLIEKGRVVRGWLGIEFQPELSMDILEKYGLKELRGSLIVKASGPAEKAGLKPGDLIIEFNGEVVKDNAHLKKLVAAVKPGETVEVKVIRDKKEREFKVKLGERTKEALAELEGEKITPAGGEEWMGLTVQELTEELARRFGYEGQQGVLISGVNPDGPAAKAQDPPRSGDLIQQIERQEIRDMDDYRQAIEKVKDEKSVMLRLRRTTRTWFIVIKKE